MNSPRNPQPTDAVEKLRPYSTKSSVPEFAPGTAVDLKLDSNEGPQRTIDFSKILNGETIAQYPDKSELESQIAERLNVDPAQVLVTCGADDALDRVCRAYLQPGRELVLPEPTFVMIRQYATMTGATIVSLPWSTGAYPVESVIQASNDTTSLIAMVSPNNPTGLVATSDDLTRIATACPQSMVLLDHAYVEFSEQDLTSLALKYPNVIVVRTLSKAWGLAGLRIGYVIGSSQTIDLLRRVANPYPVAGPSLAIASQILRETDNVDNDYLRRVKMEREEFEKQCQTLAVPASPSQANFVYAQPKQTRFVQNGLTSLGIGVRYFSSPQEALRITCPGDSTNFERLCQTWQTVLDPQAILFDMDGVLVDVSQSYRQAILQTASAFDAAITPQDITTAKQQGSANDDWELTHRLISQQGIDCSLAEVTQQFEALYQGTENQPGLWQRETRLVDPDWLAALSQRFALAVVTGRPRADAERGLEQHGLRDYFQAVICREDAALKPDPAPVQCALQTLGVHRAWMLGDTSDDIVAARQAGVLPIGVLAPQETQDAVVNLYARGAAHVLRQTPELSELLS